MSVTISSSNLKLDTNYSMLDHYRSSLTLSSPLAANIQNKVNACANNERYTNNNILNEASCYYQNTNHSNCVNNLNLISRYVDSLNSESIQALYNRAVSHPKLLNITRYIENSFTEDQSKSSFDYKNDEHLESHVIEILINLKMHLIDNDILDSFKIIVVYDKKLNNTFIYKQLLTVIPYFNGIPEQSISNISFINLDGALTKYNLPTHLHGGGFTYTSDWLSLFFSQVVSQKNLQRLVIEYGMWQMKGMCLTYNYREVDSAYQQLMKLYVPGFSKIWT